MILSVDSSADRIYAPGTRSRGLVYFQLNSIHPCSTNINSDILIEHKLFRHVDTASTTAETASVFNNAQLHIPTLYVLTQFGHPQFLTPLKTYNETTKNFIHNNVAQNVPSLEACVSIG